MLVADPSTARRERPLAVPGGREGSDVPTASEGPRALRQAQAVQTGNRGVTCTPRPPQVTRTKANGDTEPLRAAKRLPRSEGERPASIPPAGKCLGPAMAPSARRRNARGTGRGEAGRGGAAPALAVSPTHRLSAVTLAVTWRALFTAPQPMGSAELGRGGPMRGRGGGFKPRRCGEWPVARGAVAPCPAGPRTTRCCSPSVLAPTASAARCGARPTAR